MRDRYCAYSRRQHSATKNTSTVANTSHVQQLGGGSLTLPIFLWCWSNLFGVVVVRSANQRAYLKHVSSKVRHSAVRLVAEASAKDPCLPCRVRLTVLWGLLVASFPIAAVDTSCFLLFVPCFA